MGRIIRPLIGVALAAKTWSPAISAGAPVHEIQVEAKRFTFVPASIEVTAGEPVRLVIHSTDGTHGFAIRDLKIRLEVPRSGEAVITGVHRTASRAVRHCVLRSVRPRAPTDEGFARERGAHAERSLNQQ